MSLTIVSCYYDIPNKHSSNMFFKWFENTMQINCPYVIFTTQDLVPIIQRYRKGLSTYFIIYNIYEFYTYRYKDQITTHPKHCPSVLLNLIWNEKINMIHRAATLNVFNSDWFAWIDAGISTFRDKAPPPISIHNVPILSKLPTNKCIYTSSNPYNAKEVDRTNYYHHISGTFMFHKNAIPDFAYKYYWMLDSAIRYPNIWTEQVILTHLYKKFPEMFFRIGDGYGEILNILYR